jgi:hypothetical protein
MWRGLMGLGADRLGIGREAVGMAGGSVKNGARPVGFRQNRTGSGLGLVGFLESPTGFCLKPTGFRLLPVGSPRVRMGKGRRTAGWGRAPAANPRKRPVI